MITTTRDVAAEDFAAGTGWEIKPEGACKGEICVPLPDGYSASHAADRLGMAVVNLALDHPLLFLVGLAVFVGWAVVRVGR